MAQARGKRLSTWHSGRPAGRGAAGCRLSLALVARLLDGHGMSAFLKVHAWPRWPVDVAGIALCAAILGHAAATYFDQGAPPPLRARAFRARPASAATEAAPIAARNIFCSTCNLGPVPPAEQALAPVPTSLPLTLVAVLYAPPPFDAGSSLAVVRDREAGRLTIVGAGDRLGTASVARIDETRVHLDHDGRHELLDLLEPGARPVVAVERPAPPGIRRLGEQSWEIERAALDAVLSDTPALVQAARIVPEVRDGRSAGFRLHAVRPDGVFARNRAAQRRRHRRRERAPADQAGERAGCLREAPVGQPRLAGARAGRPEDHQRVPDPLTALRRGVSPIGGHGSWLGVIPTSHRLGGVPQDPWPHEVVMDSLITTLRQRAAGMASAPVDEPSISRAERAVGRALPALLRAVYRHVGNGGFGPGYGLLPLLPERDAFPDESVVGLYQTFLSDDSRDVSWSWPEQLLPFCDWGCAIRACVDCSTADAAVVTFDPNVRGPGEPTAARWPSPTPACTGGSPTGRRGSTSGNRCSSQTPAAPGPGSTRSRRSRSP